MEAFVNIDNNLSIAVPLNEYLSSEIVVDEVENLDINGDLILEQQDPPIIDISTINEYLNGIKLYALQRKDKKCSIELLQLENKMQNVIFNEPKVYKQVSIDTFTMVND